MHPPPARPGPGRFDQMRPHQPPQHPPRLHRQAARPAPRPPPWTHPGPGLTGSSRNNRAAAVIQLPVGQLERRRDRRRAGPAAVVIPQRLQPADLIGQLIRQLRRGQGRVGGQQRRGDPQRQRQPAAHPRQPPGRLRDHR